MSREVHPEVKQRINAVVARAAERGVNEIMAQYVPQPYPSRAAVGVASLPRGALVEIDAILYAG